MSEPKFEPDGAPPTEWMFNPAMLERAARASYNYLYRDGAVIGAKPGNPPKEKSPAWEEFDDGNKAIWKVTIAVALNEFQQWLREQILVPVPPDAKVVKTDKDGHEVVLH